MEEFVKQESVDAKAFLTCWDHEQQAVIMRRRGGNPIKGTVIEAGADFIMSDSLKTKWVDCIAQTLEEGGIGTVATNTTKITKNIADRVKALTPVVEAPVSK